MNPVKTVWNYLWKLQDDTRAQWRVQRYAFWVAEHHKDTTHDKSSIYTDERITVSAYGGSVTVKAEVPGEGRIKVFDYGWYQKTTCFRRGCWEHHLRKVKLEAVEAWNIKYNAKRLQEIQNWTPVNDCD